MQQSHDAAEALEHRFAGVVIVGGNIGGDRTGCRLGRTDRLRRSELIYRDPVYRDPVYRDPVKQRVKVVFVGGGRHGHGRHNRRGGGTLRGHLIE
ncbi:hypothetical protein GCM10008020_04750 [Massilia psychrophila]|nr:hypothetical protein GCM10008020_04750 [Massilia psychrophila]